MSTSLNILSCYGKCSFDPMNDDPINLPSRAGIYMVCSKNKVYIEKAMPDVQFSTIDGFAILYIGISRKQGLKKRDYRNHFRGTARQSTLRKSLGSVFGWQTDREYDNKGKYRFSHEREQELSKWMQENLIIFYWYNIDANVDDLETQLIKEFFPPLNISKNKSSVNMTFRKKLKELRR